jgi:peptide/nickel transport system ATP-binding protein
LGNYPYQFSGGMLQRAMIAMALSCVPRILIADEPTSALDMTTQVRVLDLMRDLVSRFRTSMLLVTHSLGIVARYARRLYVMYAGQIVESGSTQEVFHHPLHPYTRRLLECIPMLHNGHKGRLSAIEGYPPDLRGLPGSCSFLPQCSYRSESCLMKPAPFLARVNDHHYVRCYGEL